MKLQPRYPDQRAFYRQITQAGGTDVAPTVSAPILTPFRQGDSVGITSVSGQLTVVISGDCFMCPQATLTPPDHIMHNPLDTAKLTTALTGTHNDLVYTANAVGVGGNANQIAYIDPGANNRVLELFFAQTGAGVTVTVALATGPTGAITTTAQHIYDALRLNPLCTNYMRVDIAPGNTGAGIVTAMAATPLAGGSDAGTGAIWFDMLDVEGGYADFSTTDGTLRIDEGGSITAVRLKSYEGTATLQVTA